MVKQTGTALWILSVAALRPQLPILESVLDEAECARARRFYFAEDRERFIVAHGALRRILGACTGQTPAALRLVANPQGKPALAEGRGPQFNLSHSGDLVLIGVSAAGEIGVDVEQHRPTRDWPAIARQVFSPSEQAALFAMPAAEAPAAFFALWAAKEAFIKAIGLGFSHPPESFSVALDLRVGEAQPVLDSGHPGWCVHPLAAPAGYAAALAATAPSLLTLDLSTTLPG